jgi:transposase
MHVEYSRDLREQVVRSHDAGVGPTEIARVFGIPERTIFRWLVWAQSRPSLASTPRSGRPPRIAPDHWPALRAQVAEHADATLAEHCRLWAERTGEQVSTATMSRLLARLQLPLKKRPSSPASRTPTSGSAGGMHWPSSILPS